MAITLTKDPVYLQLTQALRELIATRNMTDGARFLTEREVSEQFGISRATANKALSSLVAEGVLEFRKGIGTFVRGEALQYDLRALVSFTDKAKAAGKRPTTRVLEFQTLSAADAPDPVREALRVPADARLYHLCRLRLADAVPVILERRYIQARFCPNLKSSRVASSLYSVWTDDYNLSIAGAAETIHAINLAADDARLLNVPRGSAAMQIVSVGLLTSGEPLWWEQTLYRGDAYELHNVLGPIQAARPAAGVLRSI